MNTSRNYVPIPVLAGRLAAMRNALAKLERDVIVGGRNLTQRQADVLAERMEAAERGVVAMAAAVPA